MNAKLARALAALVLWLASCAASAWLGWDYRSGKAAKERNDAVEAALKEAEDNALIDMEAAMERGRLDALSEAARRKATERGITDANLKARPDCIRDPESLGMLMDAIDKANGAAPAAGGMPQGLR